MAYIYNETEEEKKKSLEDEERMKNARRFARMLTRVGESEEELAGYIEYAWAESPETMGDDIVRMRKNIRLTARINEKINEWGWKRFGERFWV
jgi:hypothetical protein